MKCAVHNCPIKDRATAKFYACWCCGAMICNSCVWRIRINRETRVLLHFKLCPDCGQRFENGMGRVGDIQSFVRKLITGLDR
jgi:hydrogenase maturation factor HypF (carbamoyltransferase family)